jgi:predicted naringenin-chalcone synthase
MSFVIHGLGTAHPPAALTPDDGLALARHMAGPDVRTSDWLGPIYANSGARSRFQVIGGAVVRDILNGTTESGSPFLPTAANEGVGPTTAERMAIYAEEAGPLAVRAAAAALAESGFAAESITHLITVSCTGFVAPGVDFALICELGLPPTVARTHVGFMGCHGALNGLRVAHAFARADPAARVLVCAVELCSLHYYYGSAADKLIANAIFADGAAAVVGCGSAERPTPQPPPCREGVNSGKPSWDLPDGTELRRSSSPLPAGTGVGGVGPTDAARGSSAESEEATPEFTPSLQGGGWGVGFFGAGRAGLPDPAESRSSPWSLAASGSCLVPGSAAQMGWTVGDHGFEMTLSRRVPGLIAAHLRPWLESWLRAAGLALADVKSWAVHPGGPKIVSAVEESLQLSADALAPSRSVFADYGNMSSPTVLFIVQRLRERNAPRPCVALGFGPGLVAEAALFV